MIEPTYTYNDFLRGASEPDEHRYRYAVAYVGKNETAENPGSTKRVIHGPCVVVYTIHPMSVNAFTLTSLDEAWVDTPAWYDILCKLAPVQSSLGFYRQLAERTVRHELRYDDPPPPGDAHPCREAYCEAFRCEQARTAT